MVSATAHVVIAIAFVAHEPDPPPPATPTPVVELIPPHIDESAPVEVELLADVPAAAEPPALEPAEVIAPKVASISTATRSPQRPETSATTTTDTPTGPSTDTSTDTPSGPTRNRYMDMRQGQVDLHLPGHSFDNMDYVPQGTDAQEPIHSGRLKGGGSSGYYSREGQVIATVAPDGTVKLGNKKNFHAHIAVPSAKELGDILQNWYYDDNKPVGTLGPPVLPDDLQMGNGEVVSVPHEGVAIVPPGPSGPSKISDDGTIPIIGGGFDVTDAFMRRHGQDPYASQKLAYLDSTRDERVEIGMKHRSEQLTHVAQLVQKSLAQVWTLPAMSARKEALFEMWDDCVESGSEEMVGAGIQARHLVIGFIRARLPAGSPDAFTTNEIAAFNRHKQSKATFAPYDSR